MAHPLILADSMSGTTSQPSMGAIVNSLAGGEVQESGWIESHDSQHLSRVHLQRPPSSKLGLGLT